MLLSTRSKIWHSIAVPIVIVLTAHFAVCSVQIVFMFSSSSLSDSVLKDQRCFAADSLVTLANGQHKTIAHLQPHDALLAYDDNTKRIVSTHLLTMLDFQPHRFGKLSRLSLSLIAVAALFKEVTTVSGRQLSLTSSHLLPTDEQGYVMAKNLQPGMHIYVVGDKGVLVTEKVSNVTDVVKQGYVAPLTSEGTVLVNGVGASCYATISSHRVAHAALSPMRWWYGVLGASWEGSSDAVGVHWFAKMLYEMAVFVAPSIIHY